MDMRCASSLVLNCTIMMSHFAEEAMFQKALNNCLDGRVEIFDHPKGVVHYHFKAFSRRPQVWVECFEVNFLTCIIQCQRRMPIARIEGEEDDWATIMNDGRFQFCQHVRFFCLTQLK